MADNDKPKRRKRQQWEAGDIFKITLSDGTYCLGRAVKHEPKAMNSLICAIYKTRLSAEDENFCLIDDDLISVLFVTRYSLDWGIWKVIGKTESAFAVEKYLNYDEAVNNKFVGTTITGCGNVNKLMEAYYCLRPWNSFHNPKFLDGLLISEDIKPNKVIMV